MSEPRIDPVALQTAVRALHGLTEGMDRAGGDGYGMPECPWCKCQWDGEIQHLPECELLLARQVLADVEAGIGASAACTPPEPQTVTRFEVIDHREPIGETGVDTGRVYVARPAIVELSYQDGGRTLKVFVTGKRELRTPPEPQTETKR
jgi:DNA-binding helix-hairpin-helix protein with protein kinase domain